MAVLILSFALFAHAQTAQEANGGDKRPASYSDQFVIQTSGISVHGRYKSVGNGQCVDFIKAHGYPGYTGNALDWAKYINTNTPAIGGVVVFNMGKSGHLALITGIIGDSIYIVEQNYAGLYQISHRIVKLDDNRIIGFIR